MKGAIKARPARLLRNPEESKEFVHAQQRNAGLTRPGQAPAPQDAVTGLQSAVGNRAVQQILAPAAVRANSKVGSGEEIQERSRRRGAASRKALRQIPISTLQKNLGNRGVARVFRETRPKAASQEPDQKCGCEGEGKECPKCANKSMVVERSGAPLGASAVVPVAPHLRLGSSRESVVHRGVLDEVAGAILPSGLLDKIKGIGDSVRTFAGNLAGEGQSVATGGQTDGEQVGSKAQTDADSTMASGEQEGQQAAAQGQQQSQDAQQQVQADAGKGDSAAGWLGGLGRAAESVLNPALPVLNLRQIGAGLGGGAEAVESIPGGLADLGHEIVGGAKKAIDEGGGWNCDEAEIVAVAGNVKKALVDSAVKAGKKLLGPERFNAVMGFAGKMRDKMQQAAERIKATVSKAEATLHKWWDEKVGPWIKKLQAFEKTLSDLFDKVKKKVSDGVNAVMQWGAEKWDWIKKNIVDKIAKKISDAKDWVEAKVKWARDLVGSWWDKLPAWVRNMIEGAGAVLAGPVGIAVAAGAKAADYISQNKDAILAKLKKGLDLLLQRLAKAYDTVKDVVSKASAKVKDWAGKITDKIKKGLQAAYKWIDDATGGRLSKLIAAAETFGKKIKGEVCAALGAVAGPCVEQFVPSPGELAKKGEEGYVELTANADLTVPVYKVPVTAARGSKIRISTKGDKKYAVEIVGSGSIGVSLPSAEGGGEKSSVGLKMDLPSGASKSWEKLTGKKAPGAESKPADKGGKGAEKGGEKGGPEVGAKAGLKGTVTMEYEFDASKKPDTTCGGLGGLTTLLASEGLAASLPMPFGNIAGALGQAAVADALKSCKVKLAEYGGVEVSLKGGIGELKGKLEGERAIEVQLKKTGDATTTLSTSLTAGGGAELGGSLDLGELEATGELSLTLTYSAKADTITALDAEAKVEGGLTLSQAGLLKKALPSNVASVVETRLKPLVGPGASGNIKVEAVYKVTNLQKLVKDLDEYFAKPDQVNTDGVMAKVKNHLKNNQKTELTVTLTESETYGVSASVGAKDIKAGAGVSLERGVTKVLYSSESGEGGEAGGE